MDGYVYYTQVVLADRAWFVGELIEAGQWLGREAKKNRRENASVFAVVDSKLIADYTI